MLDEAKHIVNDKTRSEVCMILNCNYGQRRTLPSVAEQLSRFRYTTHPPTGSRKGAAVAMILREVEEDVEMLFIERARHDSDPWSGHLAFPGGKVEKGEQPQEAAERETREEIGLSLGSQQYMGRISDIVGANLPVRVSCFAYGISSEIGIPTISDEVRDVFWVRLGDICDRDRHRLMPVDFSGRTLEVPAIILPQPEKPVLWGITYRLVMEFLEIIHPK